MTPPCPSWEFNYEDDELGGNTSYEEMTASELEDVMDFDWGQLSPYSKDDVVDAYKRINEEG